MCPQCRDSEGTFGVSLAEDAHGLFIAALPATDAQDSRARLRVGDYLRAIDGTPISPAEEYGPVSTIW